MADKKKAEAAKSPQPAPAAAKKKGDNPPTEKTAMAPTAPLQPTQPISQAKTALAPTTPTSAAPENGGYVTRNQDRSWFKRIMYLAWTEIKRYRRNIPSSIAIHAAPMLVVLLIWSLKSALEIESLNIEPHTATHIAANDQFPLTGERSRAVRVYFNESNFADQPKMKDVKDRFEKLGKANGYEYLIKQNLLDKDTSDKFLNLFADKNMTYLFHVMGASDAGFEYQLLTPEWVLHSDLLPPQGPFAYPSTHDAIPLRDGYLAEVAMLLNEAYIRAVHNINPPGSSSHVIPTRKHTIVSPLFNYPIHLVLNILLYAHATLQILHVIRMVRYIVEEKESGLKTLLRTMGISSKEYYVTHALVYYVILTANSLILFMPICHIIQFPYYGSVILGLLVYNMCMVMFGLMISTLFTARNGIGKVIFAIGVILHLETYLTTPNFSMGRGFLTSLNFASAFYYYMSSITHASVLGLPSAALLADISTRVFGIFALLMMIVDCAILFCVLMYLSIVYPGGQERGAPWYFLFTKTFWSGQPRPNNVIEDQNWTRQAETGKRCIIFDGVDVENRLEAVSFECYVDQVLGIYGHKNSGRSTLLRLACMIQKPDAGSVFIMEEDMVNMHHLNIIGFMDSTTAPLFEHLSVYEHMTLFTNLRLSDEHDQTMAILKCLELDDGARVSTLNASMKRRLQLGLAYTGGTKIMILDQPTEGCDMYTRQMIRDFVSSNKGGRTTIGIFSTASETDALCDRIALIARGYVMSCGSLDWMIETFGGFTSVLTIYPKDDFFTEALRAKLKELFTEKLPDATIVVDVGHNFTVLVKNEMTEQIGDILGALDKTPEAYGMSYAEVQRLTVERMYSMLDHSEATEDSLKTDRAYVQDIDRILTSPRYSLLSLIGAQISVVAKRKMLFTLRFMLNLFTQMTAFSLVFLLCLFLLAHFEQQSLTHEMSIDPATIPRPMRFLGTEGPVQFAKSLDLNAEVLDPTRLAMDFAKHSDWFFRYPAPLIGVFENGQDTMSMSTFRLGKLFATTMADNYRLQEKGKNLIKFKVVSVLLDEKYADIHNFYGIVASRNSSIAAGINAVEEIYVVSKHWRVWLMTCFCLALSLSLCSLFPAYESASGILRHMRIPSDGTPTVVYWGTVAAIDLGVHLLLLTVCCFGFVWHAGPPSPAGVALIYAGWIGAFFSVVPVVYLCAAYVAIPVKVFSIVMLGALWLPFSVIAAYYFVNVSFVAEQFALSDDSAIHTLLWFSPVHASALLTTLVPWLSTNGRFTDKIKNASDLFHAIRYLLLFCWVHAHAWLTLLIIASKSLRGLLSKMYYKIAINEFNEPPEFNLPKQMAIAAGHGSDDEDTVDGNTRGTKTRTSRTGEDKGYDQLPGLKNRDIIAAKKDLERIANNTVYDNLAGSDPNSPAVPHKSMMRSIRRDKTLAGKSLMGKLHKTKATLEAKTVEDSKKPKASREEVDVEPSAPPATTQQTTAASSGAAPTSAPSAGDAAAMAALLPEAATPPLLSPTTPPGSPPPVAKVAPDSEKKKPSISKKASTASAKNEKKDGAVEQKKDEAKEDAAPKARFAVVADSVKKIKPKAAPVAGATPAAPAAAAPAASKKDAKPEQPKTDEKKDPKDSGKRAAAAAAAAGAATPATPATPAAATPAAAPAAPAPAASKKDSKPAAAAPAGSKKDAKPTAPAPAASKKDAKPAAAAPAAVPVAAKVDPPKPADKKPEEKKESAKAAAEAKDKDKNAVTNLKAVEATRKDLIEDKKQPANTTPTKELTKETQGGTPAPTPKGASKKRSGAGRDESDVDDSDSEPDDVVVVPSLCCGIGSRGGAGADAKPAAATPAKKPEEKKLLAQPVSGPTPPAAPADTSGPPKQYNTLRTLTQKLTGPGMGATVGPDGMTCMARSRLTLSLHKPNEASRQRRMVKLDAPALETCEEDGLLMYDVYVNHKRSPQQFRLEGAIVNVKRGASVVVFGDSTTSGALLDVLSSDAIATRGSMTVAGKELENARVASIRDHMALPDFLTVREHLEQTATSYGIRFMTIADRLMELVGITDKTDWIIKDLQMPDRILVSLCTALMNRPHLIVLDEPISALCPTSSLTMWYTLSIIRALWGTVVVTQTRSPMEVEMLASHILLTQPRVVCDVLPPYDIKQRYLTQLFVRVALRQGADKQSITVIMRSQLQAREYRTEARSEEVLSFVVELASRKLHVAFKQVCGFLLNLPVSFTVSTLPLDCAFENGNRGER